MSSASRVDCNADQSFRFKNLLKISDVQVGFFASREIQRLEKCHETSLDSVTVFKNGCRLFVTSVMIKIFESIWISHKCLTQLSDFIKEEVITNRNAFTSFNKENDRLNTFYFSIVNICKYKVLSMILKTILASHGNDSVELGFSKNKICWMLIWVRSQSSLNVWLNIIVVNDRTPYTMGISKKMLPSV